MFDYSCAHVLVQTVVISCCQLCVTSLSKYRVQRFGLEKQLKFIYLGTVAEPEGLSKLIKTGFIDFDRFSYQLCLMSRIPMLFTRLPQL